MEQKLFIPRMRTDYQKFTCPVKNAASIIGDRWIIFILREFFYGKDKQGFNELLKYLRPISTRTLSKKLIYLQERGILRKKILSEKPFKVQYSLTQKGLELRKVLKEMANWYKNN